MDIIGVHVHFQCLSNMFKPTNPMNLSNEEVAVATYIFGKKNSNEGDG